MFNFKKATIVVSCLAAMGVFAQAAMADNQGTIDFTGEVTDTTCDVSVNGGLASVTIALPRVSAATLAAAGSVAGRTFVRMNLTNCGLVAGGVGPAATSVHAFWQASPIVTPLGRLKNTETAGTAAGNVEIQMLNDSLAPIDLTKTDTTNAQNTTLGTITGTPGTAELVHYAQYYATGASTAGLVKSQLEYVISYN